MVLQLPMLHIQVTLRKSVLSRSCLRSTPCSRAPSTSECCICRKAQLQTENGFCDIFMSYSSTTLFRAPLPSNTSPLAQAAPTGRTFSSIDYQLQALLTSCYGDSSLRTRDRYLPGRKHCERLLGFLSDSEWSSIHRCKLRSIALRHRHSVAWQGKTMVSENTALRHSRTMLLGRRDSCLRPLVAACL